MKQICSICLLILSFYLGVYNGNLAIWEDGQSSPSIILPYKVNIYPIEDQNSLKEGIPFEDPDELSGLLEDFIS